MREENVMRVSRVFSVLAFIALLSIASTSHATIRYVSLNGGNGSPYTNWTTAAHNIQDAIDVCADGDTVLVTNGTYQLDATIIIPANRIITLKSVNGPQLTVLDGGYPSRTNKCLKILSQNSNETVIVEGFTIRGGYTTFAETAPHAGYGGGFNGLWSITVRNSLIYSNRCLGTTPGGGGGVTVNPGGGATIDNCTIANNFSTVEPGGLQASGSVYVRNSIIVNNTNTTGVNYNYELSLSSTYPSLTNCCTTPQVPTNRGSGNFTNVPLFVDAHSNDYRLSSESPCRDTGLNLAWMSGAIDLDGNPRIAYGTVDRGCYEYPAPSFPISASAGLNGSIAPTGTNYVSQGDGLAFEFFPANGFVVTNVFVDGIGQGAITNYSFSNVTTSHTIHATFGVKYLQVATQPGPHGTISPTNPLVAYGSNQTVIITPDLGFLISTVRVDGANISATNIVTFNSVTSNRTISATFVAENTTLGGLITYNGDQGGIFRITAMQTRPNYVLCVTGTTDRFSVNVPLDSAYTIESWIKFPLPTGTSFGWNFAVGLNTVGATPIAFLSGDLGMQYPNYPGQFAGCGWNATSASPGWHFVTASTAGTNTKYYIDGMYVGVVTLKCVGAVATIGNNVDNQHVGNMDEIRVWRRALTDAEIGWGFSNRLTGIESGLKALWRFDDTTGNDSTTNHYNGTFVNSAFAKQEAVPTTAVTNILETTGTLLSGYAYINTPIDLQYRINAYLDSNANGTQDFWEASGSYFNNPFIFLGGIVSYDILLVDPDHDSDQQTDWNELIAGTDPLSSSSTWSIATSMPTEETPSNVFLLYWISATGRIYAIQRSEDILAGFSNFVSDIPATPPLNTYTVDTSEASSAIFSIGVKTNAP